MRLPETFEARGRRTGCRQRLSREAPAPDRNGSVTRTRSSTSNPTSTSSCRLSRPSATVLQNHTVATETTVTMARTRLTVNHWAFVLNTFPSNVPPRHHASIANTAAQPKVRARGQGQNQGQFQRVAGGFGIGTGGRQGHHPSLRVEEQDGQARHEPHRASTARTLRLLGRATTLKDPPGKPHEINRSRGSQVGRTRARHNSRAGTQLRHPHLPMKRLLFTVALTAVLLLPPAPSAADARFTPLSTPGIVAIMRHADAPGAGDSAMFALDDCA